MNLLNSLILGISLSAIPGPVFFETIRRTLTKGFIPGIALSIGQFIANLCLLFIISFGLSTFLTYKISTVILYLFGSIILLYIAYCAWALTKKDIEESYQIQKQGNSIFVGFGISMTNPVLISLWISLFGSYLNQFNSQLSASFNILFIMIGFIVFNICLASFVFYTKHKIAAEYMVLTSKGLAIVLAFYSISFFVKFISELKSIWGF